MDNFQNQGQQFYQSPNQGNMNGNINGNGNAPDYILWLVLGIIQICLICCCNFLTCICGIFTVIFIVQSNNSFKINNYVLYQEKLKLAKILNIVGWVLIIVNIIINIFAGMFTTILEIVS